MTLHRVAAVCLHIMDIVEAIDARCGKAVGKESNQTRQQGICMKQGTTKEEGHEDKHILDPLLRADQAHQGSEAPVIFYFILVHKNFFYLI